MRYHEIIMESSQKRQQISEQDESARLQAQTTERLTKLVKAVNLTLKEADDYPK